MTDHVFTTRSLQACLAGADSDEWFLTLRIPEDGSWNVLSVMTAEARYVIHREDDADSPRITLMDGGQGVFGELPLEAIRVAAQRVVRAAIEAQRPPMHLPWAEFHHGRFTAFFAVPSHFGAYRWIMETDRTAATRDTCFWKITTSDEPTQLQDFQPDTARYGRVIAGWPKAIESAALTFATIPTQATTEALNHSVDLEAVSFRAVTQYRTYSQWMSELTEKQREFVEHATDHAVKLRGPAGSGKTLALELKLLRELYAARAAGQQPRILFATHSWAMAEQVDEALRALDESGDLSGVEVLPLIAIAQSRLPRERMGVAYSLLGEDSLTGRQLQLEKIAETLDRMRKGDWIAFRQRVSDGFRQRIESPPESGEGRSLVWDLMNEFASVLSANGILPGINAERQYLLVQRHDWMMPLANDTEKLVVLRLYAEYVRGLKAAGTLTTDQLINDYHNYLQTFAWNIARQTEGFDYIFVDELHLFGEQERLVLHYLTPSGDRYPRLFMALDPRQSPNEVYAGFAGSRPRSAESGEADRTLGVVDSVDLAAVHRFSPEILQLVRHLNNSYPALDMGPDWHLDLTSVGSSAASGARPSIARHSSLETEIASVIAQAIDCSGDTQRGRVAIILLDPLLLDRYEAAAREAGLPLAAIRGRDDVDQIRYTKRSVVLSAAEYVGGLQFQTVICAGFTDSRTRGANLGYRLRRFLSLLYLALSRAVATVRIHVNEESGGVPAVLETAVEAGIAEWTPEADA